MRIETLKLASGVAALIACWPVALAHGGAGGDHEIVAPVSGPSDTSDHGAARWLAGDHHIHSRYSVGFDTSAEKPEPIIGGDAIYPIPMNAMMARRFGLSWMVATDHGGPGHSKINHDRAYPELVLSRELVPDVVQFFGLELNTPGADHSSVIVPVGDGEAQRLRSIEASYDAREVSPADPRRNTEQKMIAALRAMQRFEQKPVVIAHHPSRSASAPGAYGLTTPAELRAWNDTAPDIAVGMEGAPGHQATAEKPSVARPEAYTKYLGTGPIARGVYFNYPTMGGFDQMTARVGGFWDSMLGEGRRWWITANSDSHVHWSEGGLDYWPGEYSKTYVHARKDPASILKNLRAGNVFVTTGDLISALEITAQTSQGRMVVPIGGTIRAKRGERIRLTIRFVDPDRRNAHGDNPQVARVDLIRGSVTGKVSDTSSDSNRSARVEKRFMRADWHREKQHSVIEHTLGPVRSAGYIRLRGTNTTEPEPRPDTGDESAWDDLWFYSNPIFLELTR